MALLLPNIFVIMLTTYFTYYVFSIIFNRKQRVGIQKTNTRLDELRCKSIKTLEEQKEFISLKQPKRIGTFKWRWSALPKIILTIIIYAIIFRVYLYIFNFFGINFVLWQAILYVVMFPLILNLVLEKFGVQKGDISVFFRGGRKK